MRFLLIVLFLVAATFGSIDATSPASKVKDLSSTNQYVTAPNRFLRTSNLEDAHDQENRGFSFSGLSSLSEKTPKVSGSMAKLWQQIQGKTANAAFSLLRVDKADDLFSSKRFSLWAKYMTLVSRKDPEGAMLAILSARYGEKGLAKMLDAAVKAPSDSAIVKNLQQNLLKRMKPVSVNNIAKPSNVDEGVVKIPVNPSVVKVDDAVPVNPPNPNKLDDEVDDLFAGMTVYGRDDVDNVNLNGVNRAEDVNKVPNLNKFDDRVDDLPAGELSFKMYASAEKLTPTAAAEKLKIWLDEGKSIDDVFIRLQFTGKAGDKLLDDPLFVMWLTYADDFAAKYPGKTTSAVATLSMHYGDDGVAMILEAAKKVAGTREVALKLEAAQRQAWLEAGKNSDDVFVLLKLDKAGDDILMNPVFASYNAYLKIFNQKYPDQKTGVFAKLTAQYGEAGVARVVEAALAAKSNSVIAKTVQAEQFERWMANKKSTDDIFKLLALDKAGDKLLESPLLNTFTKYMKLYNKRNPDQETTLVGTLTSFYGDVGLAKLLAAGKDAPATSKLATDLQVAQIERWIGEGKNTQTVFTMFDLGKSGKALFSNSLYSTFTKFADAFHAKNPGMKITESFVLRSSYSEYDLAKMVLAAEKVPSEQSAGKRLEAMLFKDWTIDSKGQVRSPDIPFKMLGLDQVKVTDIFQDAVFLYWLKFMDDFDRAFPGLSKPLSRTALTTTYKDEDLVKAIAEAQKNPKTKDAADKLEGEMLQQFTFAKKDPLDVAKLMKMKEKIDAK